MSPLLGLAVEEAANDEHHPNEIFSGTWYDMKNIRKNTEIRHRPGAKKVKEKASRDAFRDSYSHRIMPALVLCGNRTFVAGDDLRTFTFFAILLRLIQIVCLIRITILVHGSFRFENSIPESCRGSGNLEVLVEQSTILFYAYICSGYVTALVGIMLEIGICTTSGRGTPVQTERRANLQPLCHCKIVPMSIFRLANTAMGVMIIRVISQVCYCGGLVDNSAILCPKLDVMYAWLAILIGSHFAEAAIVGIMGMYFVLKQSGGKFPSVFVSAEEKWQCCCKCCCTFASLLTCCLFGGRDGNTGDFADIAIILADFFDDGGTLDIVASDIVIGLRVLARVQNQKEAECRVELKRRVSFVTSVKQGKGVDDMKANIEKIQQDMEASELQEAEEGTSEKLRLVQFADASDEELGEASNVEMNDDQVPRDANVDDSITWTGSIHLGDEEVDHVTIREDRTSPTRTAEQDGPKRPKNSAILSEELEVTDEVVALIEEDDDTDSSDDVVGLTRIGSEKTIRRKAITFNLHRTRGLLHYKPAVREVLSRKNIDDKLAIAEGARFMRFAAGVYYFRRYNAQRRSCEVCCALGEKGRACVEKGIACVNNCRNKTNEIAGRDFLNFRIGGGYLIGDILESRFLALAGLEQAEIKYVQFGEGVARTPYSIAVDHAWKSVVIVIRGTEGLDDVVADLRMVPVSMEECGTKYGFDGSEFHVHAGMLACAEWIHDDLESHGIVDKLLSEPRHEGYTVRLTGHSLGAGTSAILSFIMKIKYPDLRCSCFCPPGCTVSENMAEECKPYLTSYVLDHDIVPRLSLTSLENLRNDMLDMIARLKVTKFQATHANPEVSKDMLLHRQDSIPPSKFKEQLDEFCNQRDEAMTVRGVRAISLYPPGNIVQLVKTTDDEPPAACCLSSAAVEEEATRYAARWAHVEDFTEVIISSHFLDDHSSPNVLKALEDTAGVFALSSPFTVAEDERPSEAPQPRRRSLAASLWRRK